MDSLSFVNPRRLAKRAQTGEALTPPVSGARDTRRDDQPPLPQCGERLSPADIARAARIDARVEWARPWNT
jgi:hypothetical protein